MAGDSKVTFKAIKNVSKLLQNGNDATLLALAIAGSSQAKLLSPVADIDGGLLRNSINFKVYNGQKGGLNDSAGFTATRELTTSPRPNEAFVGATASYAPYQEFGTRKMAPQPYLRPSLALIAGQSPKVVKEKMDEEFKKGPLVYGEERVQF